MDRKEFNEKAAIDVYKNANIALQSISDLLPDVDDKELKTELKNQYEGYEDIVGKIATRMNENGVKPVDVNPMKKAMLKGSIKMKTMFNHSRNQIAEMMLKGSTMGINELQAMQNESENLDPWVKESVDELLALEKNYEDNLRKYL